MATEKKQLDPTRVDKSTSTIIDNFLSIQLELVNMIYPLINGLSDHDAQVLILHKVQNQGQQQSTYMKQMINNDTIANFQLQLSQGTWESVFDDNDVNKSLNLFRNIILRTYYSSFPLIQKKCIQKNKERLTGTERGFVRNAEEVVKSVPFHF
jgi:hypothetical protein